MSEQLFVVLMLGALVTALHQRRSPRPYAFALLSGPARRPCGADARERPDPARPAGHRRLGRAATVVARRSARRAGRGGVGHGRAVDDPQRGRAARLRSGQHPARVGFGRHLQRRGAQRPGQPRFLALAAARSRIQAAGGELPDGPGDRHGAPPRPRGPRVHRPPPRPPRDRRLLEHPPPARPPSLRWSRHTASTISVDPGWADAGVVSFWIFAALVLGGATHRATRRIPGFVWSCRSRCTSARLPRRRDSAYRAPLDPFVVLLAAIAVTSVARTSRPGPAAATSTEPRPLAQADSVRFEHLGVGAEARQDTEAGDVDPVLAKQPLDRLGAAREFAVRQRRDRASWCR